MKLTRLVLKNFAAIWAGMNLKEINIDFTKCNNRITLLVGRNGSGKTSLLSNIHPFPYLGTLDIRNTQELILEGKEGLKIFEFEDGDTKYRAEHHYLIQSGRRKTLCFFKKNGKEMNPSGTVKSFYDVINMEFNLDQAFLKVIRLGPNVNDIITMKASERKDFISTFLSEIDAYSQCFKVANEESKFIKNRLKLVTSEYDKLDDISEMKILKENTSKYMEVNTSTRDTLIQKLYSFKGEMKVAILDEFKINDYLDEYNRNKELIESDKFTPEFIISQKTAKSELGSRIDTLNYKIKFLDDERMNLSNELVDIETKMVDIRNKINLISQNNSIDMIDDSIRKYEKELEELGDIEIPELSKSGAMLIMISLEAISEKFEGIMHYDHSFIRMTKELMMGKKVSKLSKIINSYADDCIIDISKEIATQELVNKAGNSSGAVLFVPSDCDMYQRCPYYTSFHKKKKPVSIENLNNQIELYTEFKNFGKDLEYVLNNCDKEDLKGYINSSEGILAMFLTAPGKVHSHIEEGIEMIEKIVSTHENIEKAEKIKARLNELKLERASLADLGSITVLNDQLNDLELRATNIRAKMVAIDVELDQKKEELNDLKNDLEVVEYNCEVISQYEGIINKKETIVENYNKAMESLELIKVYDAQVNAYETQIRELDNTIRDQKNIIDNLTYKIMKKEELETQKNGIEERFEYVELIKESLSSTKGIPLIFIQLYLKNIQIFANQIIQSMFDDSISLCDFIITDKEFSIPYKVNGIEVTDISYASQGQRATISLALSFAILQQFISKYNILLLDEMDGPLYKDNKEKFVRIIEEQMERIGCEQCIMITHNNIFENYPVDLIFTSPLEVNDYNKSNVIWKV